MAEAVEVVWEGFDELIESYENYSKQTSERVDTTMEQIGAQGKEYMQALTSVRTGRLREGVQVTPVAGGFELGNDVPYFGFVNYGTRYMAAQPMLEPTAEWITGQMENQLPKALG
jgi:HK97 gp10 family phage protein